MKKLILSLAIACLFIPSSQAQVLKRLAERAKQKLENKAGDKIEKGIDDATDPKKAEKDKNKEENKSSSGDNSKRKSDNRNASSETTSSGSGSGSSGEPAGLKTYSKYDFIPGEKILVYENFAQDAVGDFPGKWNTNSSGEIVTLNNKEGKWFKLNKKGAYQPEFITNFPDNFTLEFDLGVNNKFSFYSSQFFMNFVNLAKPETEFSNFGYYARWNGKHAVVLDLHPTDAGGTVGLSRIITSIDGNHILDNTVQVHEFNIIDKTFTHVSIWRQNQRMRVYVNNEKIWDLPKAFGLGATYNSLVLGTGDFHTGDDFYVLSNIRLAVGAPDTRNKLITEGKFVTHGILFDVNSDQVKPESYGTIKEIANVLTENSGVKVKVIGHTDSDGDDKANLELSKKRAESVKNALVKEFGIDASRIETDGKGESQPVDKENTPVAKANNRRVEFVKL